MLCSRVQKWPSLLSEMSPLLAGSSASTGPFLADGTMIRPGTASGEATKRSVGLYLPLGFNPPQRQTSAPSVS